MGFTTIFITLQCNMQDEKQVNISEIPKTKICTFFQKLLVCELWHDFQIPISLQRCFRPLIDYQLF